MNISYVDVLKKTINETKDWLNEKKKAQSELTDNDDPVLTVYDINEKV